MTDHIPSSDLAAQCAHIWIANSGRGGTPQFRPNRQMSLEPLMHVLCCECNARTWMTEKRWYAMNEAKDSSA
jgi:hypothetical protein